MGMTSWTVLEYKYIRPIISFSDWPCSQSPVSDTFELIYPQILTLFGNLVKYLTEFRNRVKISRIP